MKKFAAVFVMGLLAVINVLGAEEVTNTATLYWTGADVGVSGGIATNAATWDIRLMDAGKVPRWKMRTAFINADVRAIGEALTNGLVVATTGIVSKVSSTVSWAYVGAMGGEYRAGETLKFYTLILDRAFDGKTGEYLMTEEEQGSIETNSVAAGECGMDFGVLSDEKWSRFEIAEEEEEADQTNEVKLVWSGVDVAFAKNSTTNASKWEVYLMDEGQVSQKKMREAFESKDYNTCSVALAKGSVTKTSGMLGSSGTNGAWESEGLLPEEYCGTNVVKFYTLILNEKYTRNGGYYLMTDILECGLTNGQEVCVLDFGVVTNVWTAYKKMSGSSEKEEEEKETLPIVDPAEEGAQYTWSGMKVPLNGGSLTNSVNWDIKLIDAGKVPREEMVAALESKEYKTIHAAVTNGLVASTTAKIWEATKMVRWSRQGRLPKEYRQGSRADLKFYTVIFDESLSPESGNYLITEIEETHIPDIGLVVIAFGDLSGLKWNAYTIEEGSSGGDDGDGEDEDDDDDGSAGKVVLDWTGGGIISQTGLTKPNEWKVFLMDEEKMAMTNLIAAFKEKDYRKVVAKIEQGVMKAPENITGLLDKKTTGIYFTTSSGTSTNGVNLEKAAWDVKALYLPEEYTTEKYQADKAIRCYTLILNHGLDEKQSGRYLLSRVVSGNVIRVKEAGEEETYTCKLDFGSYSASNRETRKWCAYSFEQSAKSDAESDDVDLALEDVTLAWTGEKLPRGEGEKEPSEWEFILMDARKVSISKLRAAFSPTDYVDYGKVTWLIDKGYVASKIGGTSANTNSVNWSFSGTLADEYLTEENRTENELRFYTLVLDHSLTEGETGRYFVTRVQTGNISVSREIAAEDDESETTYSCEMTFGSQAFMGCTWRKYKTLVVTGEEYEDEDDAESAADIEFSSAQVYDGYLTMDGTDVAGTIQVKVSKEKWNKKEQKRESTIKATIQLTGEKKVSIKGTLDLSEGEVSLEAKDGRELELEFTMNAIEGMFDEYEIVGARNIFTTKDKTDKTAAKFATNLWKVPFGITWLNEEGSRWNNLVMMVGSKGKVKIVGTVDGQKVSTTAQLFVDGEGNTFVSVSYSKKSVSLAFVVGRTSENVITIGGLEEEDLVYGEAKSFEKEAAFSLDSAALLELMGEGVYEKYLPEGVAITVNGTKWVLPKAGKVSMKKGVIDESKAGENPAGLKLSYKAKDGSFSGSFKVYANVNGKLKATSVSVSGVVVDGVGYGTATIKKVGSVPIVIE
jgi:hypothetical protein